MTQVTGSFSLQLVSSEMTTDEQNTTTFYQQIPQVTVQKGKTSATYKKGRCKLISQIFVHLSAM